MADIMGQRYRITFAGKGPAFNDAVKAKWIELWSTGKRQKSLGFGCTNS
jgi:hypothetical protein